MTDAPTPSASGWTAETTPGERDRWLTGGREDRPEHPVIFKGIVVKRLVLDLNRALSEITRLKATRSEGEQMTVTTVRVRKGRPPKTIKTEVQIGVRFTLDQIAKIDAYCEKHNVTRPEAVRRMVEGST